MTRGSAVGLGVAVALLSACGAGSPAARSQASIEACLRSAHVGARTVPPNATVLGHLPTPPRAVLTVGLDFALIAQYASTGGARGVFAETETTNPVLRDDNIVVVLSGAPGLRLKQVQACAFGRSVNVTAGPLVAGYLRATQAAK